MRIRKVNQSAGLVASVVDNLSTTSKVDALSANQGVILKNMIEQGGGFGGDSLPVGSIIEYTSDIIPEGWLLCNGQAVSRSVYIDLFNIIGTDYGQGDGVMTFNIPDLRGKSIIGKDENDTDFNTLGKVGGEKTHTLTISEMPSHSHSGKFKYDGNNTTTVAVSAGSGYNVIRTSTTDYNKALTLQDNGGSQSHNNLQPYMTTNYIIKASKKGEVPKDAKVINNLESTSSTDALSANMGKTLNDKIIEINDNVKMNLVDDRFLIVEFKYANNRNLQTIKFPDGVDGSKLICLGSRVRYSDNNLRTNMNEWADIYYSPTEIKYQMLSDIGYNCICKMVFYIMP